MAWSPRRKLALSSATRMRIGSISDLLIVLSAILWRYRYSGPYPHPAFAPGLHGTPSTELRCPLSHGHEADSHLGMSRQTRAVVGDLELDRILDLDADRTAPGTRVTDNV